MKKKKPKPIIYLLVDRTNNMGYVGQTTKWLKRRFNRHAISHTYIGNAIRAHGAENFARYVLMECASKGELNFWEQFFIILLGTRAPKGYNLTDGGEGTLGFKIPRERTTYGRPSLFRDDCPYKNLVAEMKARGLDYKDLAELLGVTPQTISHKMRGDYKFTAKQKAFLAEYFGKPVEYLFERDDAEDLTQFGTKISSHKRSYKEVYKNLVAEMEARGITVEILAELLRITPKTLYCKLRGEIKFLDRDKVKLVEIFGKPIEYLLARDDA